MSGEPFPMSDADTERASGGFPVAWIRLGEGAPSEAGVYLRASDVAAWLRSVGEDDLAALIDDDSAWPATEALVVFGGSEGL